MDLFYHAPFLKTGATLARFQAAGTLPRVKLRLSMVVKGATIPGAVSFKHHVLYIILLWLYFTPLDSTLIYYGSTSMYLTLHYSTLALLHTTLFHIILLWMYFTLLDSALLYIGSTSFYFTPHNSTMAVLHSTLFYYSSTSLYLNLYYSTEALLHST